jgi:Ca-activated chloride channel family protein
MVNRGLQRLFLFLSTILLSPFALAQVMSIPSSGFGNIGSHDLGTASSPVGLGLISSELMTNNLFGITNRQNRSFGEASSSGVSKLDLKAPWKARHEYEKGYQLLMRKDLLSAIEHLSRSTELYPSYVAAHIALGSAYLNLGRNDEARTEFGQAVALDDHLPNSHLDLGVAQLALNDYPAAEESLKKASSIAPLDLSLLSAMAYGQFVNKDYPAVIATAGQVHQRKHEGSAVVHYYAAGAWEAQNNLARAQTELETLLSEEPKFPGADQVRKLLEQLKADEATQTAVKQQFPPSVTFSFSPANQPTSAEATSQAQKILQDLKEKNQIAEAEAAEGKSSCETCNSEIASTATAGMAAPNSGHHHSGGPNVPDLVLRAMVDEVAVFFAATDHGRPVTDLTRDNIAIRDNQQPPAAILGFRSEAELPLRLGLVVDTSDSVSLRFSFEQGAATNFLHTAVTGKDDLAFIVAVNNTVRLMQDFTADKSLMSRAIGDLIPSGGTALWDAIAFAADKLASRPEKHPVARILVVISDGGNNSSIATLKDAVEHAQHGDVAVYTVSTRDYGNDEPSALVGEHALYTLSNLTGGTAFTPGSLHRLKGSLANLQQLIRGRYMVSYKPASFQRDGRYRAISITAEKEGHKMKVYSRKGYYASIAQTEAVAR